MLKKLKLFPSDFFFDADTEKQFRIQLNARAKRSSIIAAYLVSLILATFVVASLFQPEPFVNPINFIRLSIIAICLHAIKKLKRETIESYHKSWFWYGLGLTALCTLLFYNYAATYGELKEGGPMILIILTSAINMICLKEKLVMWLTMGVGLLAIHFHLNVDLTWTFYFYSIGVVSMSVVQYQTDILMRSHFRFERIETEKANTDKLTGIYNRRSFDIECTKLINALPENHHIGIAMIDIDYFKRFNDFYGHLAGDKALIEVAKILSGFDTEMVIRFGGEEFILVKTFEKPDPTWLNDVSEHFKTANIIHKEAPLGYLTVSLGVVIATKSAETDLDKKTLLSIADECLYHSKNLGRNRRVLKQIN